MFYSGKEIDSEFTDNTQYFLQGQDDLDSQDGLDGVDGEDGKDGENSEDGEDGVDGKGVQDEVDGKDDNRSVDSSSATSFNCINNCFTISIVVLLFTSFWFSIQ